VSGRLDQAVVWTRKGIALDPGNPSGLAVLGWIYLELGDERHAADWINLSLESGREVLWPNATMEYLHLYRGEEAEALDYARKVLTINPTEWFELAYFLSKTGEQERADLLLDRSLKFIQTIPRLGFWDGHWVSDVRIYALQGKTEEALAALRQAINEGWRVYWWYFLEHDPILDSIRDEPKFQAMLEEVKADMAAQLERVRAMEASGKREAIPAAN
jgi:tetratricopeptide (TPR) repeat protein